MKMILKWYEKMYEIGMRLVLNWYEIMLNWYGIMLN